MLGLLSWRRRTSCPHTLTHPALFTCENFLSPRVNLTLQDHPSSCLLSHHVGPTYSPLVASASPQTVAPSVTQSRTQGQRCFWMWFLSTEASLLQPPLGLSLCSSFLYLLVPSPGLVLVILRWFFQRLTTWTSLTIQLISGLISPWPWPSPSFKVPKPPPPGSLQDCSQSSNCSFLGTVPTFTQSFSFNQETLLSTYYVQASARSHVGPGETREIQPWFLSPPVFTTMWERIYNHMG